jgi:hypothetical protein
VVGSVPIKTNEDGTGVDPVQGDSTAKTIVAAAPLSSDPKALQALAEANRRVAQLQLESTFPWTTVMVTLGVVCVTVVGLRFALQKFGPEPSPRLPLHTGTNSVIILEDENWK